jgi:hypothetical protein
MPIKRLLEGMADFIVPSQAAPAADVRDATHEARHVERLALFGTLRRPARLVREIAPQLQPGTPREGVGRRSASAGWVLLAAGATALHKLGESPRAEDPLSVTTDGPDSPLGPA